MPPDAAFGYDPDVRRWIEGKGRGRTGKNAGKAAILAVGSLEQHGAHLAMSTDTAIASEVARRVAKTNGYLLMPPVPYGVSFEHAPMFNASLRSGTLAGALGDLADSLGAGGLGTLIVVNGHHGNQDALARLCGRPRGAGRGRMGRPEGRGARVLALSYWHFMDGPFDHAGMAETSLMLAVRGGGRGARMDRAARGYVEGPGTTDAERAAASKRASVSFASVAPSGVWGDPRGASAAHGRRLLASAAARIAARCRARLSEDGAPDSPHEILYSGPGAGRRVR